LDRPLRGVTGAWVFSSARVMTSVEALSSCDTFVPRSANSGIPTNCTPIAGRGCRPAFCGFDHVGTGYSSPAHPHGLGHGYYLAEPLDEKAMGELLVPVA
jgi:hypothetical protein